VDVLLSLLILLNVLAILRRKNPWYSAVFNGFELFAVFSLEYLPGLVSVEALAWRAA
jgi:hypothetical protein